MTTIISEHKLSLSTEYTNFLQEVKSKVITSRIQIARSANRHLTEFYWWMGENIMKRQELHSWGKAIVEQLAKDLNDSFPNTQGFSARNLWLTRQFYLEYKDDQKLQQLVAEIPWGHNILIINKVKTKEEHEFYIKMAIKTSCTRNTLNDQIASGLFQRYQLEKHHNFEHALPKHLAEQAEETMKSIYMLDMLGLQPPILEAEMEAKIIEKIKKVMLELGYGFSFIGNQYAIRANNKDYFIDLLFFNRRLQTLVAVELKVGEFKPEYAGKMNFYLNLLDDFVKEPHENPSIGIILCSHHDRFEVDYALKGSNKPMGIANYMLTRQLPEIYKDKLPAVSTLANELKKKLLKD